MTRALIVDDKEENLYLLRALFQGHGYEVDEARHGAEALVKAGQSPPDIVVSDLLMPVMDGYTLLRRWKTDERWRKIPFIVYTATYTDPKDEQLALDLGADAFILKPAEPEVFMGRIRELLTQQARHQLPPANAPRVGETEVLKEYSETLVRKLEEKAAQLEQANRELREDIARREQAEADLLESEARIKGIVDSAMDAIISVDAGQQIVLMNPAAEKMFGYPVKELLGKTLDVLLPVRHRTAHHEHVAAFGRTGVTTRTMGALGRVSGVRANGEEFPLEASISQVEIHGQKLFTVILRDVTERQRTEAALRREREFTEGMIDSLPGVLYCYDEEFRFLRWNLSFERVTGYTNEEISRQSPLDYFEGPDKELLASRIAEVFEKGAADMEADFVAKDGTRTPYYFTGVRAEIAGKPHLVGVGIDISARRQAETERDLLFNRSMDLLCVAGFDGYFKQLNPAWEQALGWTVAELMARPWLDFVHPEDFDATVAAGEQLPSGRPIHEFENRYRCKDGSFRWLSWNALPLPDEKTIFAVVRDVTGRKRTEVALQDSENRLLAAERLAHVGNWSYEVATGRIVWSDELYRIFGLEPQSVELTYDRLLAMIHPEDREGHDAYTARLSAALPGDNVGVLEYRAVRPDASIVHVLVRVDVQGDAQGQSMLWFGTVQDVTVQKLAEEAATERNRLAQQISIIATTAPGALASFRLQPDGRASFPYASAAWLSLFAVTREEVAADASALNRRIHPDDLARFQESIQESARSMTDWRDEFRVLHPTRGELWVEGHSTPVREPDGSILWHGFVTDITERKRSEEALRESKDRLAAVMDNLREGLTMADDQGHVIYWNPAALFMCGYENLDDCLRKLAEFADTFEVRLLNEDRLLSAEEWPLSRVLRGEVLHDWEVRLRRLDQGWEKIVAYSGWLIHSASGETLAFVSSIDVTERRQAEAALRESEERFASAFHTSPAAITITRIADGKFVDANQAFLDLFEFSREEVIGHTSTELGILSAEQRGKLIQAQIASGGLQNAGLVSHSKSGRPIHLLFSSRPMPLAGEAHHVTTLIDITARKQAEEERQKFFLLAESSSEFIGMCDLDMQPLYVNPAGVRMVGLPDMAAACRVAVQDYFFPEDQAFIESEFFPRVLREGDGDVEIRLRHFQTGEPIWMFYYLFRVRDSGGQAVGWATVSRDITERKRAERELIESERRYRALFENMTAGFVLFEAACDTEGKPVDLIILAANRGFEITTGKKVEEAIGCRLTELLPGIEKDSADWVGTFGRVATTGEPRQFEQGSELLGVYYAIAAYQPVSGQCAVTFVDVTDRQKAEAELRDREARLRLSVKASNIGLWDWDLRTNEVHFSAEWKSQIGFGEDEIANDFSEWERRVHPEDLAPTLEKVQAFLRDPVGSHSVEFRFLHRDGTYRWIFTHGDLIKDESGQAVRMLGCHIDVTERKRTEERLRALTVRLEATREEERTRIAREIHDVLGQLLTGLKMDLASIGRSAQKDAGLFQADAVKTKVEAAVSLVDELISTVQRIAAELRPSVLDNLGLAAAVAYEARRFSDRSGIACDVAEVLDPVSADPDLATGVFRVFQELLTNVARHSEASSVRVSLQQSVDELVLEVHDNGRGISDDEIDRPRSLGLLGVRERARLMCGAFSIRGTQGGGTAAVLSVPAGKEQDMEKLES